VVRSTCTPPSTNGTTAFQLPPGYRPRSGRVQLFINVSSGGGDGDNGFIIAGPGVPPIGAITLPDGAVVIVVETQVLDGTTFRAEDQHSYPERPNGATTGPSEAPCGPPALRQLTGIP
jgi:hypothetical protein